MTKEIPLLTVRDVELRVGSMSKDGTGCSLLVYKDARVDMRILDEVFGQMNWERKHEILDGQLFCTVRVWDAEKGQWISKQDVGTESKTEAEKGRVSDAFKRACFNIGIGRELYDAPFIWIKLAADEVAAGRLKPKVKFKVSEMEYNRAKGEFDKFVVVDQKGCERFRLGAKAKTEETNESKTPPESRKAGQEPSKPPTPSDNTQTQLQAIEKAFGGEFEELPSLVRTYNGKVQVYVKEAWRPLAAMDKGQLQWVVNQISLKDAHDEAFRLLLKK